MDAMKLKAGSLSPDPPSEEEALRKKSRWSLKSF